ncbi:MAG: chromosome segregation protein SMC, partial [Firmicutes bacterium]|nr:chromosome segregation protein SMC [Bacillota bacterium]
EEAALNEEKANLTGGSGGLLERLERAKQERADLETLAEDSREERLAILKTLEEAEAKKNEIDGRFLDAQNRKFDAENRLARNETLLETYKNRLWEDFEVSYVQAIEFRKKDFVMSQAQKEARAIKDRMKELGDVNVGAIKEYETVSERYTFLTEQRKDLENAMDALVQIIQEMDKNIRRNFRDSFNAIAANFTESFTELFGGGTAELRLEDESKPLECGIEIDAQPPGKKLQNMSLLSGGEKTMTAIALMFAILKTKPTPFCILDEVEAALDEMNIEQFANYLKSGFKGIQFALITHQKRTMEHADVLYGITMPERGISKVISLKLGDEFDLE